VPIALGLGTPCFNSAQKSLLRGLVMGNWQDFPAGIHRQGDFPSALIADHVLARGYNEADGDDAQAADVDGAGPPSIEQDDVDSPTLKYSTRHQSMPALLNVSGESHRGRKLTPPPASSLLGSMASMDLSAPMPIRSTTPLFERRPRRRRCRAGLTASGRAAQPHRTTCLRRPGPGCLRGSSARPLRVGPPPSPGPGVGARYAGARLYNM
jgi:hypothetical protein